MSEGGGRRRRRRRKEGTILPRAEVAGLVNFRRKR